MSAGAGAGGRPRLNPFAFPSDTAFRFGLLIAAVLGANLYVWQWIGNTTKSSDDLAAVLACTRLSGSATSAEEFIAASDAFTACFNDFYRYQVWWMLGGTALLLLVAAALVLVAPLWIVRRRSLQPLTAADAPAVVAAVEQLAAEQGLEPPRLWWNPLDGSASGLAFGHPGRYSVAVGAGLVVKQVTDPPAFAAVLRHELAHIRNRDVGITYFALAIWYAFLLVAVLPFGITLVGQPEDTVGSVTWRLLALAALVYLTRNAVLRSREVYADLRASIADGPTGALRRVVGALPRPDGGRIARLRGVHPDPEQRLAALADTRPLFPLSAAVAFAAGLTATIAFDSVVTLLVTFIDDPIDLRFVAALVFVPLAVGIVGVAVWREAFAAHADGRRPAAPWVDGLALAAGFALGPELALERIVTTEGTLLRDLFAGDGIVWAASLVVGFVLLVAWIRTSASWWLRALGGQRPLAAQIVGLVVAGAALTSFTAVFSAARELRESLAFSRAGSALQHAQVDSQVWTVPRRVWQFVMDGELLVIVHKPYFVPVLAALVLFPFAAALVRRRTEEAPWAFLDPGGRLETPPLTLRPLLPLAIGVAFGLLALAVLATARLGVHYGASAETRATDAAILSFYVATVAIALAVQLLAGAAGAVRGGLVGALGAAFVAGSFGWLGVVGGPFVGGCVEPLSLNPGPCAWTVPAAFSWDVFKQVVGQGAIVGLAGGAVTIGVQWLRRRSTADEPRAAGVSA
jgi:Zn-dependent protease with chaperone function